MALIDKVKQLCDRLVPLGWRDLLLRVTRNALDIQQPTAAALQATLMSPIPDANIDRTIAGFQDFAPGGSVQGIQPGSFARSLFYHAC